MKKQIVQDANIPKNLFFDFTVVLFYEPMAEKRYELYSKLEPREKAGMLVRHVMKIAKKYGVSQDLLSMFVELREDYRFYSKWNKEDRVEMKEGKRDMKFLTGALSRESKYNLTKKNLVVMTRKILRLITKNEEFKDHAKRVNEQEKKQEE